MNSNNKRLAAIDLARGISVILMVLVHCMLVYGNQYTRQETVFGYVVALLGQGAPMFLITMGISFSFSKNTNFWLNAKRAVMVLLVGYGMNVLKFIVPILFFGGLPFPFISAYDLTQGDTTNLLFFLGLGDILQLAGLSLLVLGLLRQFVNSKYIPFVLALVVLFSSKALSGFRVGITGVDYLLDLLWGNEFNVYFPLFPWIAFILMGYTFGIWYHESRPNHDLFYLRLLQVGFGFLLVGIGFCLFNYAYHFGDYYHLGPGGTLGLLGLNLIFLFLGELVVKAVGTKKYAVIDFVYDCSKNVTALYVTQWVLVNWGMYLFGFWNNGSWAVAGITLLIGCITVFVVRIRNSKLLKHKKGPRLKPTV